MAAAPGWFKSEGQGDSLILRAGGSWTIDMVGALDPVLRSLSIHDADRAEIDASGITGLDTAGAWLLYRTRRDHAAQGVELRISGLDSRHAPLIDLVALADAAHAQTDRPRPNSLVALVNRVGRSMCEMAAEGVNLLNFFGLTIVTMARTIVQPRRLRVTALVNQIEQTGLNAMGIVGLLLFLIGVVLAFQGAEQLRRFAAEIFTADGLAVLVLREIGVLIAAILIAGRSGSAFTAEIGMMKVNEEIDALSTIGIDPI